MKKIQLSNGSTMEIGRVVKISNTEYTIVGITAYGTVFANLKAKNVQDVIVLEYTDEEIKELIKTGEMQGYRF